MLESCGLGISRPGRFDASETCKSPSEEWSGELVTNTVSEVLRGDRWTRVVWVGATTAWTTGSARRIREVGIAVTTAPVPWPISSGTLPDPGVTHRVIGYGDIWLYSPVDTTYLLVPVFP